MKSFFSTFALSLITVCILSSCLNGDDTDYYIYDDTAITGFTLGTLKYYRTVKTSAGKDSTYSGSITGSNYPCYIDQLKKEITNAADSLPVGTDLEHVLITVSTKNNGYSFIKNVDNDTVKSFSSSDSLDFSKERTLVVYSSTGKYYTSYNVNIVAHKEYADSMTWNAVDNTGSSFAASLTSAKAAAFNDRIFVLGAKADGKTLYSSATSDGKTWSNSLDNMTLSASIAAGRNNLYVFDNGTLYSTTDGTNWNQKSESDILTIAGASFMINGNDTIEKLYAIAKDTTLVVSEDGGAWKPADIDDDKHLLPTTDINMVCSVTKTNGDITKAILVGNADNMETASVWSKVEDKDDQNQKWNYQPFASYNNYKLPGKESLAVASYDEGMIAVCGNSSDTKKLYYSADGGLAWKTNSYCKMPTGINADNIAMTVDKDNWIWLICTGSGQIWKGRLNRLGWKKYTSTYSK